MDKPTNHKIGPLINRFVSQFDLPSEYKQVLRDQIKNIAEVAYIGGQLNQVETDGRAFKEAMQEAKINVKK